MKLFVWCLVRLLRSCSWVVAKHTHLWTSYTAPSTILLSRAQLSKTLRGLARSFAVAYITANSSLSRLLSNTNFLSALLYLVLKLQHHICPRPRTGIASCYSVFILQQPETMRHASKAIAMRPTNSTLKPEGTSDTKSKISSPDNFNPDQSLKHLLRFIRHRMRIHNHLRNPKVR